MKGKGEKEWEEKRGKKKEEKKRKLLQVTVEEAAEADHITSVLMGDDVPSRREFIVKNARDVQNLDF